MVRTQHLEVFIQPYLLGTQVSALIMLGFPSHRSSILLFLENKQGWGGGPSKHECVGIGVELILKQTLNPSFGLKVLVLRSSRGTQTLFPQSLGYLQFTSCYFLTFSHTGLGLHFLRSIKSIATYSSSSLLFSFCSLSLSISLSIFKSLKKVFMDF